MPACRSRTSRLHAFGDAGIGKNKLVDKARN
jgi:hypothetical protein